MYTIDKITLRTPQTTAIKNELDALKTRVENNENHLNDNDGKIVALETLTANHTTQINTKANDNQVVKLSGNQTINGDKIFSNLITFGTNLKMGLGGNNIRIQPDTGYKEIIFDSFYFGFFGDRTNGSKVFNLNCDGITGNKEIYLFNIHKAGSKFSIRYETNNPEWVNVYGRVDFKSGGTTNFSGDVFVYKAPTNNNHAANKKYVDDAKNALKAELKALGQNAADFAAFKTALAGW